MGTTDKPSDWKFLYGTINCMIFVYFQFQLVQQISARYFDRFSHPERLDRFYRGISILNYGIVDGADRQYINFRLHITEMSIFFAAMALTRILLEYGYNQLVTFQRKINPNAKYKIDRLLPIEKFKSIYYAVVGAGFVIYLHEGAFFYYILIVSISYLISTLNGSKYNLYLTWIFGVLVLVTCDYFDGYRLFNNVFGVDHYLAQLIDQNRGRLPWQLYYRITFLKMVSFNLDKYWAYQNAPIFNTNNDYTKRVVNHQPLENYGIVYYFGYVLYAPLYIAGPIVTYNCFISQLKSATAFPLLEKCKLVLWTGSIIILVDVLLHYSCLYNVSANFLWENWTNSIELGVLGFFTLQFMYLKFLCFWRYFRCAALFNEIEPIDNMTRCMHNSNTFTGFWRSWHASFNKWTIRYLYSPLGGKKNQKYSIWLIFFFIGIWHDLWWSWIAWALLNCVFFTIELTIIQYWRQPKFDNARDSWWWEPVQYFIQGWSCIFILLSNLAIIYGFDHIFLYIGKTFFSAESWKCYLIISIFFTGAAMLQNDVRKREAGCPFHVAKGD